MKKEEIEKFQILLHNIINSEISEIINMCGSSKTLNYPPCTVQNLNSFSSAAFDADKSEISWVLMILIVIVMVILTSIFMSIFGKKIN